MVATNTLMMLFAVEEYYANDDTVIYYAPVHLRGSNLVLTESRRIFIGVFDIYLYVVRNCTIDDER